MKSPGLKPIKAQNARSSSACVLAVAGAETLPAPIAVGPVGQLRTGFSQIDPHGDSVHMGHKNRMEPAVSDKFGTRPSISGSVIHTTGFVREFL